MKIETYRTKEDGFLLVVIKLGEENKYLVFLLDPWKTGYRDIDEHVGTLKSLKKKIGVPTIKFHKIPKNEAALLLRQSYEISQKLGIEIDETALRWMERLGVLKLEYNHSIYRCFNCEERDLSSEQVEEIIEIAKRELKEGKIGTEDEEQYFKICTKCKQELHEKHEGQSHHHH